MARQQRAGPAWALTCLVLLVQARAQAVPGQQGVCELRFTVLDPGSPGQEHREAALGSQKVAQHLWLPEEAPRTTQWMVNLLPLWNDLHIFKIYF